MLKTLMAQRTPPFNPSTYMAILFLASQFVASTAFVQNAEAQDDKLAIEEVIVTARYREENVQDVPLSESVYTEQLIQDTGIEQVGDFLELTPNVTFVPEADFGGSFITIRGISQVRNVESPVAVVVDGVQQIHASQFTQELFDIASIEVLRGPQGALYGRNASGGAILINTPSPTNEFNGRVGLRIGKNNERQVQGSVSGPIIKNTLYFRLGARYRELDGYLRNIVLNKFMDPVEDTTFRGSLRYQTDQVDIALRATLSRFKGGANNFVYQGILYDEARPGEYRLRPGFFDPPIDFNTGDPRINADDTSVPYTTNNIGTTDRNVNEFSLKVDFALPNDIELTSISAITEFDSHQTQDGFPYTATGFPDETGASSYLDVSAFSQELRVSSNSDSVIQWMAGVYYLKTNRFIALTQNEDRGNGIPQVGRTPPGADSIGPNIDFFADDNKNTATAFFGNINWDLNDRLELSFAYRYDRDKRVQNVSPFQTTNNSGTTNSATFKQGQPKVTAKWAVNNDANLYLSWGRGFRSGQFNQAGLSDRAAALTPPIPGLLDKINPEITDTAELGFKTEWAGGRIRLNGAVFQTKVKGFFYFAFIPQTGDDALINIDNTNLFGGEVELFAKISENFSMNAGIGITNSEIKRYSPDPTAVGNKAPYVAKNTLNLGAQHRARISPRISWFTRVDYERRGSQFWDPENTSARSAINFVSARIGFEGAENKWSVMASGTNLLDEEFNSEYVGGLFPGIPHRGLPRIWSLECQFKF